MAAGEIEVLILAVVNPVYAMPPKAGFADALGKVPMVVSLATRPTETSARAGLLPLLVGASDGVAIHFWVGAINRK
jgi:anaerobic selenocysteine-containing dehydrogenase